MKKMDRYSIEELGKEVAKLLKLKIKEVPEDFIKMVKSWEKSLIEDLEKYFRSNPLPDYVEPDDMIRDILDEGLTVFLVLMSVDAKPPEDAMIDLFGGLNEYRDFIETMMLLYGATFQEMAEILSGQKNTTFFRDRKAARVVHKWLVQRNLK
jgi:hypothetical protein